MRPTKLFAIPGCLLAAVFCGNTSVLAEEEELEEISVVGSRGHERSASDLAVPVDVLDSSELIRQGDSRMDSMLSKVVPSLYVGQEPISDAATLVRPINMRGLSPDSTLVLVNGKRRHRSSIVSFLVTGGSQGSHAVDLSALPAVALDRVEVLRDGAAAQYGSDAVAGIVNFVLKDASEGGSLEARWGQYYQGDGENITISGNLGLPLTENGFLNLSGEYNEADPTSRSMQRGDAQSLIDAGNMHVRTPAVQVWGAPEIDDNYKLFANAGLGLGDSHEAYAFGSYSERTVEGGFYYRNPHTRDGIFNHPDSDKQVMVIDHNRLLGDPCPEINIVDGIASPDDLAAVEAREDCFAFNSRFPGGFTPQFGGDIEDSSIAFGLRGEFPEDLGYDISYVTGRHEVDFFMKNTINPQLASMELDIPTEYRPGGYVEEDWTFNLDFTRQIDVAAFHSPLNVGFGVEYREEEYEIKPGEPNSWFIDYINADPKISEADDPESDGTESNGTETDDPKSDGTESSDTESNGSESSVSELHGTEFDESTVDLSTISCEEYTAFLKRVGDGEIVAKYPQLGIGSNGFQGFRPDPCGSSKNDRTSVAAYLDFEADVEENLLMGLALRYEDPEEFDSTWDGKFSARFQATDTVAVRGSLGSGFRVPTVGQANIRNVTTGISEGKLSDELTVPPTSPLLAGIAEPLEAEESFNAGFGTVFNVGALDVTVDYYHIEVKDRISLTSKKNLDCLLLEKDGRTGKCGKGEEFAINLEDADTAQRATALRDELRSTVPDVDTVTTVRYFANDFDTKTEGIDVVAIYPAELFGGTTQFTFVGNYNRTRVDEYNPDTISPVTKHQIEEGRPKVRWSLTADHQAGPWRVLGRMRYYGTHVDYQALESSLFQKLDARYLMDLEISYDFNDRFVLVAGAENLLDEEPSKSEYSSILGAEYPESVPFDYNGGFYYFKTMLNF